MSIATRTRGLKRLPCTFLCVNIISDNHAEAARWSGWLNGGRSLMNLFFMPLWGAVSDVRGRRPVVGIGLLGCATAWGLVAIVPTTNALILSTIVLGTTVSVVTTCAFIITSLYFFSGDTFLMLVLSLTLPCRLRRGDRHHRAGPPSAEAGPAAGGCSG